jgi:hypothetical protein
MSTVAFMVFVAYCWIPLLQQNGGFNFADEFFWNTIIPNRLYLVLLVILPLCLAVLSDIIGDVIPMILLIRGRRRRLLNPHLPRLYHAVIVCNYKEPIEVLRATIQSIAHNTLSGRCIVILACEDRDEGAEEVYAELESEFSNSFRNFIKTNHVLQDGEVAGKSSNENYACRELSAMIRKENIDPFQVMVTTCDADSLFDRVFLEQVEAEFGRTVDGRRFIYNSPINTYRNLPECHWLVKHFEIERCQNDCFNSFGFRAAQSNYSLTLGLAEEIDFWDPTNTSEDLHTTLRAMAVTGKGTSIMVPVWSLILNDSVCTFQDRWVQAKRHMWGIEEVVFALQLFPVLRLNQWAEMMTRVTYQMFSSCTPPVLVVLLPPVRTAFFALREDTQLLLVGLLVARILYRWMKIYTRELFLYTFIIGDRHLLIQRTVKEWLLLILTWPIGSKLGSLVFATAATWRMLCHAVHHDTLTYVTAPKALSLTATGTAASLSSAASLAKPKQPI